MTFDEIRKMPGVTSAVAAAPGLWPESGLTIYGDSPDLGITCSVEHRDIRQARFSGWTYTDFHYCPNAGWERWVALAKRILEIDARLPR